MTSTNHKSNSNPYKRGWVTFHPCYNLAAGQVRLLTPTNSFTASFFQLLKQPARCLADSFKFVFVSGVHSQVLLSVPIQFGTKGKHVVAKHTQGAAKHTQGFAEGAQDYE